MERMLITETEDNTNKKQPNQEKRDKMAQKKQKKIKTRDLKPTKDVKGGRSPDGNKK